MFTNKVLLVKKLSANFDRSDLDQVQSHRKNHHMYLTQKLAQIVREEGFCTELLILVQF